MAWYTELNKILLGLRWDISQLQNQDSEPPTPPVPEPEPEPPTPEPVPDPTPDVPKISTGARFCNLNPRSFKIWEFVPTAREKSKRLQVSNTPQPNQPHTVYMLIKKGSPPTLEDFVKTWGMPVSTWRGKVWWPPKPGVENLYWQYSSGTELVEILDNPVGNDKYYIMLYNKGNKPVRSQRLIVMCSV